MFKKNSESIGPTPERQSKGSFRVAEAERDGTQFAVDDSSSVAQKYLEGGIIDEAQYEACEILEPLMRAIYGSPSQRSCLDMSPVGYDSADDDIDPAITAAFREAKASMSHRAWGLIKSVVHENEGIHQRDIQVFRGGLDKIVDMHKIRGR